MRAKSYLSMEDRWRKVKHGLGHRLNGGQSKTKQEVHIFISCGHCNIYLVICWKGIEFFGRCTQSGTPHWGSLTKIQVINELGNRLNGGQGQNKIGSTSCCRCNAICWKGIAFAGCCSQNGTHQWGSTKKIKVKHDLGSRLYVGQCQNKIEGAHLRFVGALQWMHDNLLKRHSFCWALHAKWYT